jgi:hypothetical protein
MGQKASRQTDTHVSTCRAAPKCSGLNPDTAKQVAIYPTLTDPLVLVNVPLPPLALKVELVEAMLMEP